MKKILIVMSAAAGLAFVGCRPQNPDAPAVREFIRDNWHTTVQHCTADTATLIGLPYPYTVPTAGAMFREMYYWDTFFTNEGLVRDGHPELAKGNTDNLLYMVRRFGKVYNGSRTYYEARSQTPYLSMMVDRIYRLTGDKQWVADAYQTLKEEGVRILDAEPDAHRTEPLRKLRIGRSGRRISGHRRQTPPERTSSTKGYTPRTGSTSWGSTSSRNRIGLGLQPRYDRWCTDFTAGPQCQPLHVYEVTFARFAGAGPYGRDPEWIAKADFAGTDTPILLRPRETVLRLRLRQRPALRRAGCGPRSSYSGAAPREKRRIVQALVRLRSPGIAACKDKPCDYPYQWSYPNTWASGLLLCGDGTGPGLRIRQRGRTHRRQWMKAVTESFKTTGNLWEKYNAETGTTDVSNEYEMPAMPG